jgi:hypothetical protein
VTGDVKGEGVLLIPKGARVRGRITRLVRLRSPGPYFELGLRFHRVEFAGGEGEFTAELEAVLTPGGISTVQSAAGRLPNVGGRRAVVAVLEPEEGPGSGLLIVSGTRLQLPKGLQMVWRTRSVKEAEQH